MTNSVHARDLIEGEGRRAFMFDVSGFNITYLQSNNEIPFFNNIRIV